MKPTELTVDQVRSELIALINKYPDRNGRTLIGYDYDGGPDYTCVYYTDEYDEPISITRIDFDEEVTLAKPVCIIGFWIEEFHPEFKKDKVIHKILRENSALRSIESFHEEAFTPGVLELLVAVQGKQDGSDTQWSEIIPLVEGT